MRRTKEIFGSIDGVTIILYLILISFGWINIYASMYNDDISQSIIDISTKHGKQLMFIVLSLLIGFFLLIIDWRFFDTFSFIFYAITIILLISVLLFADSAGGATSWFRLGNFKIQPSEFTKFTTALALAKIFSLNKQNIPSRINQIKIYLIILTPILLISLQNDLGTALVFTSFILVLYREGISGNILIISLICIILALFSLLVNPIILSVIISTIIIVIYLKLSNRRKSIKSLSVIFLITNIIIFCTNYIFNNFLAPHQIKRINIFLGKEFDPLGDGYNLLQSKIAIGSGGLFGKGFLNGTQTRFDFVPEQSTDFIFCTVGEEWGFLGSLFFLIIFSLLILRIIYLSEKQKSRFCRVYGYSVACILFTHLIINIGMTIGLAPVIGIPLPFMSYGGSSLLSFTILLFIFLNLNSYRMNILR